MAASFSLAVVHYHLRTGGVSRVIERAVEALRQRGIAVVVLVGEAPPADSPLADDAVVVDGLGYDQNDRTGDPDLLHGRLTEAARGTLGRTPDLWHFHNHTIGKNGVLPIVVHRLAEQGCRLLLQLHDFAEDGRPINYRHLLRTAGRGDTAELDRLLYPQAEHVHYALLNRRDLDLLRRAGFDESHLNLLPNPVSLPVADDLPDPPSDDGRRLFLYPVRGIRRKNLGEFLLWSLLGEECDRFAVTLPATSPTEKPYYDRWKQFAAEQNIPVEFELGLTADLSFVRMLRSADCLVTTSIAEGFGLTFLEPWLTQRPLIGRDLPDITADFAAHDVDLSHLYSRLDIPESWFEGLPLTERLEQTLTATRAAYGRSTDYADIDRACQSICRSDYVDFGRIDEPLQESVLRRLQDDPGAAEAIRPATPLPPGDLAESIASNAAIIREQYNLNSYAHRLKNLYAVMLLSQAGPVDAYPASAVLDAFLDPGRFNLLRAVT